MADPVQPAGGGRRFRHWNDRTGSISGWVLVGLAFCAAAAIAASIVRPPAPRLLWNASASSAVGLYSVTSAKPLRVGDMAIAWAPPSVRRLADSRSYLPFKVPLVKRVAAVRGDMVCAHDQQIFVNARLVAVRRRIDPSGRPMPWWSGCRRLKPGELFLLSSGPLAFDGRYFGVSHSSALVGKARLLWPR